jgi:extracellular elastinolytic metalloproteinase
VETSPDGTAWTVAATGHFGTANRDRMNPVALSAGTAGVKFVRYTILGSQVADSGGTCPSQLSGCGFVDTVEIGAYGAPA